MSPALSISRAHQTPAEGNFPCTLPIKDQAKEPSLSVSYELVPTS